MTAPLTPRERVDDAVFNDFGYDVVPAGDAYELAAELEEAKRTVFARNREIHVLLSRAEAAERQLAEKDARIKELEARDRVWRDRVEKCELYRLAYEGGMKALARYREKYGELK